MTVSRYADRAIEERQRFSAEGRLMRGVTAHDAIGSDRNAFIEVKSGLTRSGSTTNQVKPRDLDGDVSEFIFTTETQSSPSSEYF